MNIFDFGFSLDMNPENKGGTVARITAVHKGRFAIVSEFGEGFAQLKQKEYYYDSEAFPTVGDFVLIDHVEDGDQSRVVEPGRGAGLAHDPGQQFLAVGLVDRGREHALLDRDGPPE